jgi:GntR family transcriptional repressor for pyruvate dehydrogenase complex
VIREALRILEISGLVEIKKGPGGGIFVTDGYGEPIKKSLGIMISSGEVNIDHLFDVRLLMEPYIAMQAARHATEKDLKKLGDLIKESNKHQDDATLLKRNNLNFHLMLAEASGNRILSTLLDSLLRLLVEISMDFLDLELERHFYKAHKEIFEAIQRKQGDEATNLMQKDILDVKEKLKPFKPKK